MSMSKSTMALTSSLLPMTKHPSWVWILMLFYITLVTFVLLKVILITWELIFTKWNKFHWVISIFPRMIINEIVYWLPSFVMSFIHVFIHTHPHTYVDIDIAYYLWEGLIMVLMFKQLWDVIALIFKKHMSQNN
jgi:hypothetical protein